MQLYSIDRHQLSALNCRLYSNLYLHLIRIFSCGVAKDHEVSQECIVTWSIERELSHEPLVQLRHRLFYSTSSQLPGKRLLNGLPRPLSTDQVYSKCLDKRALSNAHGRATLMGWQYPGCLPS